MDENKIYWVRGNTQELLIPLEQEIVPEEGEIQVEPYYPAEGATVTVCLVGKYKKYTYTPTIDGNLLRFTENGTIPAGLYGVEVLVNNPDGTQYRSLWDNQIVVTNQNDSVLQEWDEFRQLDVKARAAVFFFAKGDPFTYEDFTPEEIEDLKRPATEAAAEVAALEQRIEAAEAQRVQAEQDRVSAEQGRVGAEQGRVSAEQGRVSAEQGRQTAEGQRAQAETQRAQAEILRQSAETIRAQAEGTRQQNEQTRQNQEAQREQDMGAIKSDYANLKLDYASVKSDVVTAIGNANDAATLANQKAGAANDAATNANEKATYAKNQGDYAKEKADEIEDAKGEYQTLDARLDAMDEDTEGRLERITQEQFNEIFS